ncbi:YqgE/AlgH family protein [Nitrospira sp. Kam-Ns4a]
MRACPFLWQGAGRALLWMAGLLVALALFVSGGHGIPVQAERLAPMRAFPIQMPPPAKGVFLIASPALVDPNFRETVVLLCEHGPQGTLGLIVNRPSPVLLADALPGIAALKGTKHRLFLGGPVQPTGVLLLFRVKEAPPDARQVMDGVFLGGSVEFMERLLDKAGPGETFRAYAGYAGWAPGQLEAEMAMGSWATLQADPASVFDRDPDGLWGELLQTLAGPWVIRTGLTEPTLMEES